jgi:hypothetical protein
LFNAALRYAGLCNAEQGRVAIEPGLDTDLRHAPLFAAHRAVAQR